MSGLSWPCQGQTETWGSYQASANCQSVLIFLLFFFFNIKILIVISRQALTVGRKRAQADEVGGRDGGGVKRKWGEVLLSQPVSGADGWKGGVSVKCVQNKKINRSINQPNGTKMGQNAAPVGGRPQERKEGWGSRHKKGKIGTTSSTKHQKGRKYKYIYIYVKYI